MNSSIKRIAAFATLLAFSGCGSDAPDIHSIERETKPYESAPVNSMNPTEIVNHLQELSAEMSLATSEKRYAEMHHLEVALTKALNALENTVSPAVKASLTPTIDTLKIVAAKIHGAGHDQNESMAATLDNTLADQVAKLQTAIDSQP